MQDVEATPEQLISTLTALRQRVTHLEASAATLQRAEARFRGLLEAVPDAIVIVDSNGRIQLVNAQTEKIFGYPRDALLDQPVEMLMPERFRGLHVAHHTHYFTAPRVRFMGMGLPLVGQRQDGSEFPVDISLSPVATEDGLLVISTVRDVTERKRIEDELLKAQKMEAVGVLAGGIAHDFNNLLTAILGNISLAKLYAQSPDKVSTRLAEAEKACLRARELTQQLLTFAKGGVPVRQTAAIAEVLAESATFALHGSRVRCACAIPDDLWPVDIDRGQMHQVFLNVILNAAQAMPDGGMVQVHGENITLGTDYALPLRPGRYVKITICDTGCGIPAEHLPKIFDPYFTTKERSSGLGLPTAYTIVAKHDGHITVESAAGIGTTVAIYLPASQHPLLPEQSEAHRPGAGGGRILVMDDEAAICDVACAMLTSLGYDVTCAQDGAEALMLYYNAKAAAQPFTAVLLDLTVPGGMGGRETMAQLRAIDPQVKAIVSSGYSDAPVMGDFRQYGFSAVIVKPYTLAELGEVLRRVLAG
jgi:PAS domain S-box-containing protein